MKDRIKLVRKNANLTQKEFAERLGIKQNTVASYEIGRIGVSDNVIFSICRVFRVNEEWLRDGKGPMYKERDGSFTELLSDLDDSDDDFIKSIIKIYMELDENSKETLRNIAVKMAEKYKGQD